MGLCSALTCLVLCVQSVEFWSTLCDIEMEMIEENDPAEVGGAPQHSSHWSLDGYIWQVPCRRHERHTCYSWLLVHSSQHRGVRRAASRC